MSFARTFDANDQHRGFFKLLRELAAYPATILRNRYMVQNFFRRELMGRFHGSFLGAWWMLVQPVFLFAVYYLVFGMLFDRGGGKNAEYALYLFSGVIMFHALVEATSTCCNIIVSNNNLVKKVAFPSEALPVPVAMVSVVLYLVGAIVCVAAGIISGVFTPGWSILALPLVVIVQFMMVMGIGLLLGNANVFVRDVGHLWRIFSMAWMFLSPVFWTPNMLFETMGPDSIVPGLMMNGNPAYPLIMAQRIALAGELPDKGMVDFWGNLGIASLWAIGFVIVGFTTFVANKHKHSDII